ncbi:MAG: SWIM zinc finger family protein [Chloroflexi bacterium]|nr:SWIM zinc finger family protein [Chloroflexota bacterium]
MRGQHYFRDGSVSDMARRGNLITAFVQGNDYEPYRVQVTLADFGIAETSCTCPYEQGGICKHIVATLLTAIHQPETITEKPPIATLLADLTAEQLRQILPGGGGGAGIHRRGRAGSDLAARPPHHADRHDCRYQRRDGRRGRRAPRDAQGFSSGGQGRPA